MKKKKGTEKVFIPNLKGGEMSLSPADKYEILDPGASFDEDFDDPARDVGEDSIAYAIMKN